MKYTLTVLLLLGCGGHQHPANHHEGAHHGKGHHHSFADAEKWAKRWDNPERDAWQKPEAVLTALALKPNMVVADLGAGTGYFAMRFAAAVPEGKVYALDIEPAMVKHMEARAQAAGLKNVHPMKVAPEALALPEPVDLLFVCNVYHHIDARTAYFAKAKALLKPGGRLVIVDYKKDFDGPGPPKHFRVTPDDIVEELKPAGFVEQARDEGYARQYVLSLTVGG